MIPWDLPLWFVLPSLFVLGATIGSFLNVCVYRIPRHDRLWDQLRNITSPPSHCPKCKSRIAARDNLPILGWLMLGGRCRNCRLPISPRYPAVELFNGLLFALVYWMEVPAGWGATSAASCLFTDLSLQVSPEWGAVAALNLRYLYHLVLLEALVVASLIDWDERIIPDATTVPAMIVGLLGGAAGTVHLVPIWFQDPSLAKTVQMILPESWRVFASDARVPAWIIAHPHWHGLAASAAGLAAGWGLVWGVRLMGAWILRREAMGFGDVVLMGMIGSFLGWQAVVMIFFVAPLCALLTAVASLLLRKEQEIPYGPYLSIGTLVVLLAFRRLWPFWERIFESGILLPMMLVIGTVLLGVLLWLTQLVKRVLGIPLYGPDVEYEEVWTSADQLQYQSSENQDRLQGRWRLEQWPGTDAGQGTRPYQQWLRGGQNR